MENKNNNGEGMNSIPPSEQVWDMSASPVTEEEMEEAMRKLKLEVAEGESAEIVKNSRPVSEAQQEVSEPDVSAEATFTYDMPSEVGIKYHPAFQMSGGIKNEERTREDSLEGGLKSESSQVSPQQLGRNSREIQKLVQEIGAMQNPSVEQAPSSGLLTFETKRKFKVCEKCGGSGRRLLLFRCGRCQGSGRIVTEESTKDTRKA